MNSPSIVGTGRVGPRQRSRITYSSHSDIEAPISEAETFFRQKSFEDKSKGTYFNNQKSPNVKRSQSLKKKDGESKYLYHQRQEARKEDNDTNSQRHYESEPRSYAQKDLQKFYSAKSPKPMRRNVKATKQDSSNKNVSGKRETQECLNHDLTKLENDVVTENSETLQISQSAPLYGQTDTFNTKNEEQNVKNEITNKITSEKETEIPLTSLSVIENTDEITKDDTNINNSENESDCSHLIVNNVKKDLQESINVSSDAVVLNNIEFKEELMPNESNNVSDNIVKIDEALSSKGNQQSLSQVNEQFANDNCDIIDEVTEQRNAPVTLL